MRKHTPTLYAHPETDPAEADDELWDVQISRSYATSMSLSSSSSTGRNRAKLRSKSSTSSSSAMSPLNSTSGSSTHVPKYSDIYSQFVRRYRSEPDVEDDPRNDPDSHYFQRGLGQLVDAGDSDDEELVRATLPAGAENIDRFNALLLESEPIQPATLEDRERLEWQTMLASVLDGDVLKSEKTRIAVALESSDQEHNNVHINIWLGLRAKFNGRPEDDERKRIEERRLRMVDPIIEEINAFRVDDGSNTLSALKQVHGLLRSLDTAQSLYPTLKAFHADKPATTEGTFQARCDTLITWSNVLTSLMHQIALLKRWTGSETLDVTQPNTSAELPIGVHPAHGAAEVADGSTFVERVLKEDSIQRTFEKGFLTTVHTFIGTARDAQVNLATYFKEMNLPTFENELVPVISFPTKLVQASLRVRLDYVQRLKDPEVLIIDQNTEDLKISIGLACLLKRQYEAFLSPDPGGNWNLPQCIREDYDSTILEALSIFFKLIHWKLKSGVKGIYFKETDVLEAQWATFNDVSLTVNGGSSLVAEQLWCVFGAFYTIIKLISIDSALTNKLMVRVTNYFETQVRVPTSNDNHSPGNHPRAHHGQSAFQTHMQGSQGVNTKMTDEQMAGWYGKILESVRLRYRKLQRFARSVAFTSACVCHPHHCTRVLTQRFSNCSEYNLEDIPLETFIATLVATDHFLVYTQTYEEDGTYIVAPKILRDRPDAIRRILLEAFHVDEVLTDEGIREVFNSEFHEGDYDEAAYLLVISPRTQFLWNGLVLMLEIPKVDLDVKDNRVRLVANGPQRRLALAKQMFAEVFLPLDGDEDEEPVDTSLRSLTCLTDQQAHLPVVNRELRKIARATNRLAESIVDSVHHVRNSLRFSNGCQELLENWYLFASEHGQHAQKYMERSYLIKFNRLLIRLAISWVSFICDDCDPTDRKTFRWAVNALEFTLHRTKRNNILNLPDDQFELLRQKVASCMTLLISHFDILGARSILEARKEKERMEEVIRQQAFDASMDEDGMPRSVSPDRDENPLATGPYAYVDANTRMFWEKVTRSLRELESGRTQIGSEQRLIGRVLDDNKPEDRSLVFLASSSSNISIRWQQGRFIGAGAFGSVYLAVNLDSGALMAVKEIKFQELSGLPNLYSQIKDELGVMEMLHHPNVVEYYGIEVHRDKVYIFEEYCQGGSLAALLEHGRIEDEGIIQVYTMQMLEGLAYLHSQGIVHRDIKPDSKSSRPT